MECRVLTHDRPAIPRGRKWPRDMTETTDCDAARSKWLFDPRRDACAVQAVGVVPAATDEVSALTVVRRNAKPQLNRVTNRVDSPEGSGAPAAGRLLYGHGGRRYDRA